MVTMTKIVSRAGVLLFLAAATTNLSCNSNTFVDGASTLRIKDRQQHLRRRNLDIDGVAGSHTNGISSFDESLEHDHVGHIRQGQRRSLNDAIDVHRLEDEGSSMNQASREAGGDMNADDEDLQWRDLQESHSSSLEDALEEGYDRHIDPPQERDIPGDAVFIPKSTTTNNIFANRIGRNNDRVRNEDQQQEKAENNAKQIAKRSNNSSIVKKRNSESITKNRKPTPQKVRKGFPELEKER